MHRPGSTIDPLATRETSSSANADGALRQRAHRHWTPLAGALAATGDRWTLMIVSAVAADTVRLSRLRERLPDISTGVLDHHLRRMIEVGLLTRQRFREMPPRVEVRLTDAGRELLPIAAALARWGMRCHWPDPSNRGKVEIAAVLDALPKLLQSSMLPDGTVETILASGDAPFRQLLEIEQGNVRVLDDAGVAPSAGIEGTGAAWLVALGPERDFSGLRFKGKRRIAKQTLEALPTPIRG